MSAAFKQAETPEGLRRVIRSAIVLEYLGGSATHLCEAIAHGMARQGLGESDALRLMEEVRNSMRPK